MKTEIYNNNFISAGMSIIPHGVVGNWLFLGETGRGATVLLKTLIAKLVNRRLVVMNDALELMNGCENINSIVQLEDIIKTERDIYIDYKKFDENLVLRTLKLLVPLLEKSDNLTLVLDIGEIVYMHNSYALGLDKLKTFKKIEKTIRDLLRLCNNNGNNIIFQSCVGLGNFEFLPTYVNSFIVMPYSDSSILNEVFTIWNNEFDMCKQYLLDLIDSPRGKSVGHGIFISGNEHFIF